jgi:hypothetical protein
MKRSESYQILCIDACWSLNFVDCLLIVELIDDDDDVAIVAVCDLIAIGELQLLQSQLRVKVIATQRIET